MDHKFEVDLTGTKYQTRRGLSCKVYEIVNDCVVGVIVLPDGSYWPSSWGVSGLFDPQAGETGHDLIPVPQKVTLDECWVHYGPDGKSSYVTKNPDTPRPRGGYIRHIPAMEVDANE